jgi:hypothetical protein
MAAALAPPEIRHSKARSHSSRPRLQFLRKFSPGQPAVSRNQDIAHLPLSPGKIHCCHQHLCSSQPGNFFWHTPALRISSRGKSQESLLIQILPDKLLDKQGQKKRPFCSHSLPSQYVYPPHDANLHVYDNQGLEWQAAMISKARMCAALPASTCDEPQEVRLSCFRYADITCQLSSQLFFHVPGKCFCLLVCFDRFCPSETSSQVRYKQAKEDGSLCNLLGSI